MKKTTVFFGALCALTAQKALSWDACDGGSGSWKTDAIKAPIWVACVDKHIPDTQEKFKLLAVIEIFPWSKGRYCGADAQQINTAQMSCALRYGGQLIERRLLPVKTQQLVEDAVQFSTKAGNPTLDFGQYGLTREAFLAAFPSKTRFLLPSQQRIAVDYYSRIVHPNLIPYHSTDRKSPYYYENLVSALPMMPFSIPGIAEQTTPQAGPVLPPPNAQQKAQQASDGQTSLMAAGLDKESTPVTAPTNADEAQGATTVRAHQSNETEKAPLVLPGDEELLDAAPAASAGEIDQAGFNQAPTDEGDQGDEDPVDDEPVLDETFANKENPSQTLLENIGASNG